ncbi:unnamed protein product, partial [Brenthis ino]
MAGIDWYYNFMARHPNISLRRPEATSINRITAFNQEEIDIFFENLKTLMVKYQFKSNSIYNVDETGISTVQRNSRILAPKGLRQVGKCTSAERGSLTTVINCFNAGGTYIPPFFIFKRKRMNALLMKDSNSNMVACVSDSGWITESIFVDWLQHFKAFAKPSADEPILLILDNHERHISLRAHEFCRKNFIHVLTLPPHTSHKMQPLDLTFHGPLKTAYNRECESFMVNHPGTKITAYDVVGLYTKAFNRTTSIDKAMNGFRSAGICPMDRDKFKNTFESFGDMFSSVPPLEQRIKTNTNNSSQNESQNESHVVCDAANQNISNPIEFQEIFQLSNNDANLDDLNETIPTSALVDDVSEAGVNQSITSQTCPSALVPLSDIVQVPTIKPTRTKRLVKKKHSIIFTSTQEKVNLEQKEQKKIERKRKNLEQKKTKTTNKRPKLTKEKRPKDLRNLKKIECDKENDEYFCIYCQEKYFDPPTEDWIMCLKCKNWAHENCNTTCDNNACSPSLLKNVDNLDEICMNIPTVSPLTDLGSFLDIKSYADKENNPPNSENGHSVGKDFSPDDSSDEYLPPQQRGTRNVNLSSSSSNLELKHSPTPKKGKKRNKNPQIWKKNISKQLKNSGKEYISHTGKKIASKLIRPPCDCRLQCRNKFSEDQRKEIFKSYWNLASLQRQRDFLCACIEPINISCRRIKNLDKPRTPNCSFSLLITAVMPVPIGESSAFYYKSKHNCLNFTISDLKNKTTDCYFWHEGLGNRGAIEIGSCVFKFLEKIALESPNN